MLNISNILASWRRLVTKNKIWSIIFATSLLTATIYVFNNPIPHFNLPPTTQNRPFNIKDLTKDLPKTNMDELAKERIENLRKHCGISQYYTGKLDGKMWGPNSGLRKPRLFFSDKHKLLMCTVPKCGSTSWRTALLLSENDVNFTSAEEVPELKVFEWSMKYRHLWTIFNGNSKTNVVEINERLNQYYRIMIVREPLERLVSAYIEKMVYGRLYYKELSRRIHKNTTGQPTFEEFVDYIINHRPSSYDVHWALYSDICDPCHMNFDFIVKLETMVQDAEYVCNKTGFDCNLINSKKRKDEQPSLEHKWKHEYRKYLEDLPPGKLLKLYQVYSKEYELFGYSIPPFLPIVNNSSEIES